MALDPAEAADRHLPLKAVHFQILRVLLDGDLHGYGITKAIDARTSGLIRLEPGNLYRFVQRLQQMNLVEPMERRPAEAEGDRRRQYYAITSLGRATLAADVARMRSLVADAERALGDSPPIPGAP